MKKTIFEDYEQMNIGNIDYSNSRVLSKKKCFTKKRLFIFIFLIAIIFLIIYLIKKSSKKTSESDSNDISNKDLNNNNLENELNLLTKKEEELKAENNKLFSQKESIQKENDKMSEKINELTEENKKQKDKNNDIDKEISEKKQKVKDYENKLKDSKKKIDELTKKQKDLNEKLNKNNSQVKTLEQKIDQLEKEIKEIDNKEEGQKENNKEEDKKEGDKKEDDKKEDDKKEEEKKDEEKEEENKKDNEENKNEDDNKPIVPIEPDPKLKSRIDSEIIIDPKSLDILDKWFKTELKYKLLYRATEEKYSPTIFHSKVDQYKNTIIFIKDKNNFIYGGFTRKTWDGKRIYKADQNAIVFNLDKEIYYKVNNADHAIFCDPDNLAIFGDGDIILKEKSIQSSFPKTYGSTSDNKKYELTLGFDKLSPVEMEVFQLS